MSSLRAVSAILLTVAALLALPTGVHAQPAKGVHVLGEGRLKVPADVVTLALSMETIDDDLLRVRQTSDKQAQTILAHLKKQGAPDSGFQVTGLTLTFGESAQLKRQIYTVQRSVRLELGDLSKLDALLADLLKEPFAKIQGITFGTSKQREHEFAARAKAIADAKEKAKQLAELNGLKLGRATNIQVVGERQVPFAAHAVPSPAAANLLPRAISPRDQRSTPVSLDPPARGDCTTEIQAPNETKAFGIGEIVITAEVSIDFELE